MQTAIMRLLFNVNFKCQFNRIPFNLICSTEGKTNLELSSLFSAISVPGKDPCYITGS